MKAFLVFVVCIAIGKVITFNFDLVTKEQAIHNLFTATYYVAIYHLLFVYAVFGKMFGGDTSKS